MTHAEREFWLTLRRQFMGVRRASLRWYGSGEQSPADRQFTHELSSYIEAIILAIERRCGVTTTNHE